MPSPFPGMDPFIEARMWGDFHTRFNALLADTLNLSILPRYVTRLGHRVVVERYDGSPHDRYPDVGVFEPEPWAPRTDESGNVAVAEPRAVTIPAPDGFRQTITEIRDVSDGRLVTCIGTMSPSNKRLTGKDREAFESKRLEALRAGGSIVEIDLLRCGRPLPPADERPAGSYAVLIAEAWRWPDADLYDWPLMRPLPTIPVPLSEGDDPIAFNAQEAFETLYERAGYRTLDYSAAIEPPLPPEAERLVLR